MSAARSHSPDWDLSSFFPTFGGAEHLAFRDQLRADLRALTARLDALAPIADDQAGWAEALVALEELWARATHLGVYVTCSNAADGRDRTVKSELIHTQAITADVDRAMVRVRAAFAAEDERIFASLLAHPLLAGRAFFLTRQRRVAAQAMDRDLEDLAAELGLDGIEAWARLYQNLSSTLTFELQVPDRAAETHPIAVARSLMESPDAAVREAALEGSNRAWERIAEPVSACLNAIAGTRLTLYRRRGIEHFHDPALLGAHIERRTLDAMLDAVRTRQPMARRFLARKARLLGKDRLGFQDLGAPLPDHQAPALDWAAARERVLSAFGRAYPALADFARHAFEQRWIDHTPRPGRRPGGFCASTPVLDESRIFLTYNGAAGDLLTLAHELGHGFHSWVMRDLPPWARRYPMTLAETASTFAEQLVGEAALAEAGPEQAIAIREGRLTRAAIFLLDIPMRFDFETALYEQRARGELSSEQLTELMLSAQRESFGDALAPDELNPMAWASKLHYYITRVSFYNFPYTFGYLFSMGLFARFRAQGASFIDTYEHLLRATGSETAEDLARDILGVDLGGPDFWHASIDLIEEDLKQLEAALNVN